MRPVTLTVTGNGASTLNSTPCPVDWRQDPANISLFFTDSGSTTGFTVQYTGDAPGDYATAALYNSTATWFSHAFMAAMTANTTGNFAFPVRAIRLQADASGTDVGTLKIIQSGTL